VSDKILRKPEVVAKTGMPNSTLYAAIARGEFPAPLKLGVRASGWLESEVEAWLESRVALRAGTK
jgi:prophage regulatory protein